jgi:hypothetical protein
MFNTYKTRKDWQKKSFHIYTPVAIEDVAGIGPGKEESSLLLTRIFLAEARSKD